MDKYLQFFFMIFCSQKRQQQNCIFNFGLFPGNFIPMVAFQREKTIHELVSKTLFEFIDYIKNVKKYFLRKPIMFY